MKLREHDPDIRNNMDTLLLVCIRRVNLVAFWSRSSGTVKANAQKNRLCLELSQLVGLNGGFIMKNSYPCIIITGTRWQ